MTGVPPLLFSMALFFFLIKTIDFEDNNTMHSAAISLKCGVDVLLFVSSRHGIRMEACFILDATHVVSTVHDQFALPAVCVTLTLSIERGSRREISERIRIVLSWDATHDVSRVVQVLQPGLKFHRV